MESMELRSIFSSFLYVTLWGVINRKRGKLFYTHIFENIGKNKNETSSSKNCVHEKKKDYLYVK